MHNQDGPAFAALTIGKNEKCQQDFSFRKDGRGYQSSS
jgi:hypothetical protein